MCSLLIDSCPCSLIINYLTLKKPKKKQGLLKHKAGSCTGQVPIAISEETIGVTGGATMIEMQQECERHLLPVYGAKAVLTKRLKQHLQEHQHHSSKRAKPKNMSSFFASYQPSKNSSSSSSSSSASSSSTDT